MKAANGNKTERFIGDFIRTIYDIRSKEEFDKMALAAFLFQYENNTVYKQYVDLLKVRPEEISKIEQIPFLPVSFFKTHEIVCGSSEYEKLFLSSGTSGESQSRHFVRDLTIYEKNFLAIFERFYGEVQQYKILALLPSYLEREGSSLVYMVDGLIKKSKQKHSGFYLHNLRELTDKLKLLNDSDEKVLLIGIPYALLDLIENYRFSVPKIIVMETGGMKGKRKEMVKEELHKALCDGFDVKQIHSEYGMTELLSQAYSKGNAVFSCPPWMKLMIRDLHAPSFYMDNSRTGGINIIDLANILSCCFIETQDMGISFDDGSFKVTGRIDSAEIRGCNLLINS
jgi:phenylacetate-coenzyme A ligase PaaK-like adenylate-forming protein